jgi:spore coat polysaccharide biosynthesis protein SpsF
MSRAVAFVQARTTSSRLPGKVMESIGGCSSIVFIVQRLRRARTLDDIVFVTSDDPTDDELADTVSQVGFAFSEVR